MDRRTYLKHALVLSGGVLLPAGVLSLVGRHGVVSSPDLVGFDGKIMGTGYSIRLAEPTDDARHIDRLNDSRQLDKPFRIDPLVERGWAGQVNTLAHTLAQEQIIDQGMNALAQRVHLTLQSIDSRMSTWRGESELSVFNNSSNRDWHQCSAETFHVIDHAIQISDKSSGAFDVTVGPLVDLWGFGAIANNTNSVTGYDKPTAKAVDESMQRVGYNAIEIDHEQGAVRKTIPESRLDLSGIAKGFAVDELAELLDGEGYENYLVEVGGELRSRGQKPDNSQWRVAIESPSTAHRDVFRVINLHNGAIATSGDYRNFYMDGGKRYSHSIDPRIGRPVNHELVSVSVVAASTMQADAFSTALIVMGPEEAFAFAERNQIAAHLILKSASGKLEEKYSSSFAAYLT